MAHQNENETSKEREDYMLGVTQNVDFNKLM
jgi:hypothetical protein